MRSRPATDSCVTQETYLLDLLRETKPQRALREVGVLERSLVEVEKVTGVAVSLDEKAVREEVRAAWGLA